MIIRLVHSDQMLLVMSATAITCDGKDRLPENLIPVVLTSKKLMRTLKPGKEAPFSGQYVMVGPRGGHTGIERTVVKGEPLPPTLSAGQVYRIVDKTKTR